MRLPKRAKSFKRVIDSDSLWSEKHQFGGSICDEIAYLFRLLKKAKSQ